MKVYRRIKSRTPGDTTAALRPAPAHPLSPVTRVAPAHHSSLITRHRSAFTLIELLVVIAIIGILAGLSVPALKNLGKSNVNISAARQLLDDVGRARQLAIANRTTVYMVFVPTNFWTIQQQSPAAPPWLGSLNSAQLNAVSNLVDNQLSGYTFISQGTVGDQPGRHNWRYLASWQSLPDGVFIAARKFAPGTSLSIDSEWVKHYGIPDNWRFPPQNQIYAFTNLLVPFPTATNQTRVALPGLAFDYSGRLVSEVDASGNYHDAYIPLAKGNVVYGYDGTTKRPQLTTVTPQNIREVPAGNSSDISYNIVHIDALTGRATLEFYKMGP